MSDKYNPVWGILEVVFSMAFIVIISILIFALLELS